MKAIFWLYLFHNVARTIQMFLPQFLWHIKTQEKVLYLTFDDGVSPQTTPQLLAYLKTENIVATHFIIGEKVVQHPELVRQLIEQNQQIANHGYYHLSAWFKGFNAVEFQQFPYLKETHFVRPPYGHFTRKLLKWAKEENNTIVMWDINSADFKEEVSVAASAKFILKKTRKGSIILFHDNPKYFDKTLELLQKIIPELKARGWKFETIRETKNEGNRESGK